MQAHTQQVAEGWEQPPEPARLHLHLSRFLHDFGVISTANLGHLDFAITEIPVRLHKPPSVLLPPFFVCIFFSLIFLNHPVKTPAINTESLHFFIKDGIKLLISSLRGPGPQVFHLLSKSCDPGTRFTLWIITFLQDPQDNTPALIPNYNTGYMYIYIYI